MLLPRYFVLTRIISHFIVLSFFQVTHVRFYKTLARPSKIAATTACLTKIGKNAVSAKRGSAFMKSEKKRRRTTTRKNEK